MIYLLAPKFFRHWTVAFATVVFASSSLFAQSDSSGDTEDLDRLIREAEAAQQRLIEESNTDITAAELAAGNGEFAEARRLLEGVARRLVPGPKTTPTIERLEAARERVSILRIEDAVVNQDLAGAESMITSHRQTYGNTEQLAKVEERYKNAATDPSLVPIESVSPEFVRDQRLIEDFLVTARVQFLNGDYAGASRTLENIEVLDPRNAAAKRFQEIIAKRQREAIEISRYRTRAEMIGEVSESWSRPRVSTDRIEEETSVAIQNQEILEKLRETKIPRVSFTGQSLSRVLQTLSELSIEYSPKDVEGNSLFVTPGVNIIPGYQVNEATDPKVSLTVFGLSLEQILRLVSQQVNYEYNVQQDVVTMRPSSNSGGQESLVTEFFPVSRATVLRLTGGGRNQGGGGSAAAVVDPFAPPSVASPFGNGGGGGSGSEDEERLKGFFERAGVPFTTVSGASLAFDGTQLIVTQTVQNVEKLRNILRRYDQTKQVEIEAKFLEVNEGALEELGFSWSITGDGRPQFDSNGNVIIGSDGLPQLLYDKTFNTSPQTVNDRFNVDPDNTTTTITTNTNQRELSNAPPVFPNSLDFGSGSSPIGAIVGTIGSADVSVMINALERASGSDLMSAPRLTVLNGKTAQITVAQELIYPESYRDISATASGGGNNTNNTGGSSSIAITAGTPQDFTSRNVGVEMEVTPTVEDNDNISLLLEPKVTEFEGFVEYGGPSVAISGNSTATVPPGFYQPIFSTREVRTEVTIYDGATVVIGGLVREEVKFVEDKVPFLGDIPLVGRLFRNEGESSLKRNLMIFVTANLVSPGGSPSRQAYRGIEANALFQNPVISTPGGNVERNR
ncbi:MAG: hypothetical protein HRU10_13480 [Opitutales bacterium]|nr:hypothetical protein [Opitutales bacterium]